MLSLNVKNCPQCGRIFAVGIREICPECAKKIDQQYELCYAYLRENKMATITQLSDETGVSVSQITKFIREGRISIGELPEMSYPCDVCHKPIRKGMMCDSCRQRFVGAVEGIKKDLSEQSDDVKRQSYEIRND